MHPDRLSYLAYNNRIKRNITSCVRNNIGHWDIVMECGHTGGCIGHMDASMAKQWDCRECSIENVKTSPRWAKEFA